MKAVITMLTKHFSWSQIGSIHTNSTKYFIFRLLDNALFLCKIFCKKTSTFNATLQNKRMTDLMVTSLFLGLLWHTYSMRLKPLISVRCSASAHLERRLNFKSSFLCK